MTTEPPLSASFITIDLSSESRLIASLCCLLTFSLHLIFMLLFGMFSKLFIKFSKALFRFFGGVKTLLFLTSESSSSSSFPSKYSKSLTFRVNAAKSSFSS